MLANLRASMSVFDLSHRRRIQPSESPYPVSQVAEAEIMSDGDLAEQRASLIEQKKRELDEVHDKHDSLVMSILTSLIDVVAKQERSEVWEEFRAPYDLWDHSALTVISTNTPSHYERRESMTTSTSQTSTASQNHESPGAQRSSRNLPMPSLTTISTSGPTKSYKAKVVKNPSFPPPVASRKRPLREKGHGAGQDDLDVSRASLPTTPNIIDQGAPDWSVSFSPKKRRQKRKEKGASAVLDSTALFASTSADQHSPPSIPQSSPASSPGGTPLPKRIRLIVKPAPPPVLATHPHQLPRPSVFGGSLPKLLSSFALLEESNENDFVERRNGVDPGIRQPGDITPGDKLEHSKLGISWDEFDKSVKAEVEIWKRIREVRARGGLTCMRGWEIVRGEEEEVEEVEEEEEKEEQEGEVEVGRDEGNGDGSEGKGGGQAQVDDSTREPTGPGRDLVKEEILSNGVASPLTGDQASLGPALAGETVGASTIIEPELSSTLVRDTLAEDREKNDRTHTPDYILPAIDEHIAAIPKAPLRASAPPIHDIMDTESTKSVNLGYGAMDPEIETRTPQSINPATTAPISSNTTRNPSRSSTPNATLSLPLPNLSFLPQSHYEILLNAIPAHARRVKATQAHRHRSATLISRYWERLQGAAERLAAAEERRLRTGARALARGVVAKAWKDAVAVIRARLREKEEAEQAREGRKHLDAILEQSSALLETQQQDLGLTRRPGGRSKSLSSGRSYSRSSRVAEEEEEEEEDREESEASSDTKSEEGVDEGDESDASFDSVPRLGGYEREPMDQANNDPDVDVVDYTDLSSLTTDPATVRVKINPDETILLSEVFDSALDQDGDTSAVERDRLCYVASDDTPTVQSVDMREQVPEAVDRQQSTASLGHTGSTNGNHVCDGTSESSTRHSTSAIQTDSPPITPIAHAVRKLTLKLKSPEAALGESRRTSRRVPKAVLYEPSSEVDGLAKDAEIPLEEIMRRYGFVGINEAEAEQSRTREPDSDDESESQDEGSQGDESIHTIGLFGPKNVQAPQDSGVRPPFLLRGNLRPYQQSGLEWLVSGYIRGNNGILADEMGLGKTIQTIALLAHLACDRGVWGPHLIIVPTSVILNWEMEFKKFLPGFKVLSYYGSIRERKEKRIGWNTEHSFNVVVTSYQLVLADQAIFRRKRWHYMILDEAHNIKNFKSQRWATLFSFNSERRLLLTGTPLQNNITELWSLLYFVQPETANKQQFEEWFLETMRHAVESGETLDEQTRDTIDKLHTVLRPYILRRLKCDVEQQLPAKHEHIVYCRLSKRQRYLYDEFMSRAQTKETLAGGNFLSIVNCLMQLRKVCNHPDLFEVRPILTSFAIPVGQSAVADYEIKELLVRRRLLKQFDDDGFSLYNHSFDLMANATESSIVAEQRATLTPSQLFPALDTPGEPPPKDLRTICGNKRWREYQRILERRGIRRRIEHINTQRNARMPVLGSEKLRVLRSMVERLIPADILKQGRSGPNTKFGVARMLMSYAQREESMADIVDRFAFVTPTVVALDVPRLVLAPLASPSYSGDIALNPVIRSAFSNPEFDILHRASVKLQIAFPDSSLLQYDCGKLQALDRLLREKNAGGHRVLIFTQMTRVLDILEIFLNFHGYRYLRLDGSTKIEQRQVVTERFNVDNKIFAFIASSRSGGVGINLTGADTVIFYDSDYNPSMDRQCEDRAHRIGQTREVSIYRFISKHTVEEAMLRKANQKRLLDDIVIQQGEFDWRQVMVDDVRIERALAEVEDKVDADAAKMAIGEERRMDWDDFGGVEKDGDDNGARQNGIASHVSESEHLPTQAEDRDEDDGLTPVERYMLRIVENDWEFSVEVPIECPDCLLVAF
ncbi:SNF2 family N-terminal domain [Rhizoctonia solani]|uniref:Helicase SWR1 n=1 Tax=Rhizoctonia solani TaxID=456999 RepID=A0A8H7IG56_9AGAM|nr:SNF2 family N-terminal domain [Rhizoctonia solani]